MKYKKKRICNRRAVVVRTSNHIDDHSCRISEIAMRCKFRKFHIFTKIATTDKQQWEARKEDVIDQQQKYEAFKEIIRTSDCGIPDINTTKFWIIRESQRNAPHEITITIFESMTICRKYDSLQIGTVNC